MWNIQPLPQSLSPMGWSCRVRLLAAEEPHRAGGVTPLSIPASCGPLGLFSTGLGSFCLSHTLSGSVETGLLFSGPEVVVQGQKEASGESTVVEQRQPQSRPAGGRALGGI